MSTATLTKGTSPQPEEVTYLNVDHTFKSWIFTHDHKRIGILYLVTLAIFFFIAACFAGMIRLELLSPTGNFLESDTYNKVFSAHGILMIFWFLVPSIPAVLGNFLIPLMIGARDVAFPRLNLLSYYFFVSGGIMALIALCTGGVDTGWTFYVPYASLYSNTQVGLAVGGVFLAGFSSIFTGLNFIVTIHKMRCPGMTWFRLPLFIWAAYATSVIVILGTPVIAMALLMMLAERTLHIGFFSPELGGDPVLFQHIFWFYSHPAVYIMILPTFGVMSELFSAFSRKPIFGYHFVAFSSLAIAALGFLVWGHHMFVSSQSMYQGIVFSVITFLIAVPTAVKIFNWTATLYKGHIRLSAPMIYAISFMGLFLIGGLTGLYLGSMATDVHLTGTYFVVAHFHYVMVGGAVTGYLGGVHFWWPKITGRLYNDRIAQIGALIIFIGFNTTFFPQFIVGFLGMPRRYHYYYLEPQFQVYNIMSSLGASVLGVGLFLTLFNLLYSLWKGKKSPANPWGAHGLEWTISSPPSPHNFHHTPIVTDEVYDYRAMDAEGVYDESFYDGHRHLASEGAH